MKSLINEIQNLIDLKEVNKMKKNEKIKFKIKNLLKSFSKYKLEKGHSKSILNYLNKEILLRSK